MANTDKTRGFKPAKYLSGAPYTGAFNRYYSDDDNLFLGDLVEEDTTGVLAGDGGYPTVGRADASDAIVGVVVGWEPNPTALDRMYYAASTTYAVYIADSPDLVLECQVDNASATPLTKGNIMMNYNFVVAAGSTTTGLSNMEIDEDSGATTATLPLKLIGFVDRPDNDTSTIASVKALVKINNHKYAGGTGTASIA